MASDNLDPEGNPINSSYSAGTSKSTELPALSAAPKDEYSQIVEMIKGLTQPRNNVDQITPAEREAIKASLPGAVPVSGVAQNQPQQVQSDQGGLGRLINLLTSQNSGSAASNAKSADNAAVAGVQAAQNASQTSAAQKSGGSSHGGVGNLIDDVVKVATLGIWIICTELMRQGKMPKKWWVKGAPVFAAYPEVVKQGYYLWAIPCVVHLRAYPNSLLSRILCVVFNWRAQSIAEKPTIRGMAVTAILWPICYVLGVALLIARIQLDWKKVYQ